MKKRLYINRVPRYNVSYGGGNTWIAALHRYCPDDFELVDNPLQSDAYFIAGLDSDLGRAPAWWLIQNSGGRPIFTRVNDCDARKGTTGVDELWMAAITSSVHTFWVSQWMECYYTKKLSVGRVNGSVIVNGVDRSVWHDVSSLGATATDGSPWKVSRLLTHHWSDNPAKGSALYLKLAERCEAEPKVYLQYIGRQSYGLEKFPKVVISPPKSGSELYKELSCHGNTVYVNWSQSDPGSNSILEALAMGLPTYVGQHGGGSPEFVGLDHVLPPNVDDAADFIMNIARNCTATKNEHATPIRDYRECAADYYAVIRGLL